MSHTPSVTPRAARAEQDARRRWHRCPRPACRRHRRCSPPAPRREPPCHAIDRRADACFLAALPPIAADHVNEAAGLAFERRYLRHVENIMARANQGMGGGVAGNRAGPNGHQAAGADEDIISESDLAADKMGDAGQQGTDPDRLTNERDTAVDTAPGGKPQPDASPIESFEMMDKDVRAAEELGKGNRDGSNPDPDAKADDGKSLVDEMSDPKDADATLAARNGI